MKVEQKTESFYILDYLLELIIKFWQLEFYFTLENLANLGHFFFMKHPLYRSESYFSGRNLVKIRLLKKHW